MAQQSPDDDRTPARSARRGRLRSLLDLLRDPQGWSARWYRDKRTMDYAAVQPRTWRAPEEP